MTTNRELDAILLELSNLFENSGETFWKNKVESLASKTDSEKLTVLLSWSGGMGSFNDLVISRYNGHSISEECEEETNNTLNKLRRSLFELASTPKSTP